MVTVITHIKIRAGDEPEWDAAFRERARAAREQPGFVSVQLCAPIDAMNERVIIGTWSTRADWEAWHANETFVETRRRLEEVDEKSERESWYEVVLEERA